MYGAPRQVPEAGFEPALLIHPTDYEPNLSTKFYPTMCEPLIQKFVIYFLRNADDYLFIIFLLLNFGFRT